MECPHSRDNDFVRSFIRFILLFLYAAAAMPRLACAVSGKLVDFDYANTQAGWQIVYFGNSAKIYESLPSPSTQNSYSLGA